MRTLPAPYCLALALVVGAAGAAPAEDDARPVLQKALKALGGESLGGVAVHSHVKMSLGILGAAVPEKIDAKGEFWIQPGAQRMRMVIDVGGQKLNSDGAYHDGKGWKDENGMLKDMDADEVEDFRLAELTNPVTALAGLLRDKAVTLKALGKSKVGGAELVGVQVSAPGRTDLTLYFDPATSLPKRAEYKQKMKVLNKEIVIAIVFDDYRAVDPAAAEEKALKAADVAADGPGLLKFLRGQVRGEADRAKVKGLIKQLGDDDFEVREKATKELIQLGPVAAPDLRQAAKDADTEIASRAARCLEKIAAVKGPGGALTAALRLVALKRPEGAAEALLALAPSLTDDADARELRAALAAVAKKDGKPDKAVEKALDDKDPARRAAAAAALGKDGGAFEKLPGRRLFVTGLKRPAKLTFSQDGKVEVVIEITDAEVYNKFDDALFAKPKGK